MKKNGLPRVQVLRVACLSLVMITSNFIVASPALAQATASNSFAGLDRYETAAKIAQAGWTGTSNYAVLSAGEDANLVDALTAAPLAASKDAPILLTEGNDLNLNAKQELERLQVSTVYVTSGSGVIKNAVLDQLHALGMSTIVLGGKDRFETSVNIAKQLKPSRQIVFATAWSNADALSVASIAAAEGIPILLTNPDSIPDDVTRYISTIQGQIDQTYVLGLEGAISEQVKNALPHPLRVGGSDRYATNLAVLKNFQGVIKPDKYYLANGEDNHLVDALVGAPLAARTSSAIVLASGDMPSTTSGYIKQNFQTNVQAFGGEGAVPVSLLSKLENLQPSQTPSGTTGTGGVPSGTTGSTGTVPTTPSISSISDVISSMTMGLSRGNSTINLPFGIESSKVTANLGDSSISANDIVMTISINATRKATLKLNDQTLNLNVGANQFPISKFGVPDTGTPGVHVSTITAFLGTQKEVTSTGTLTDSETNTDIPFSFTLLLP